MHSSLPFCIAVKIDLSAAWKGLLRGAGAKLYHYPCHCCGAHFAHLHHPNVAKCQQYCSSYDKETSIQCYHTPIISDE